MDDVKQQTKHVEEACPECGAPKQEGMGCWEQLGLLIAWEAEDPELAAEHFKIVASYNLQHPAMFTDQSLAGLRDVFIQHLDEGMSIADIRKVVGQASEGSTRVYRDKADRKPVLRRWSMTIADVFIPDQPDNAAHRVRQWAESIRSEL